MSAPASLRRRLTIAVVGITALVVALASAGLWLATRQILMAELDRDLAERSERMARPPPHPWASQWWRQNRDRQGPPEPPPGDGPRRPGTTDRRILQIIAAEDARVLWSTSNLGEGLRLAPDDGPLPAGPFSRSLTDGQRLRVQAVNLPAKPAKPGAAQAAGDTALIAVDLAPTELELQRMATVLLGLCAAACLLAWGAVVLLRSAILRPLADLDTAIGRLGPDDLASRIPAGTGPQEVRSIVERLNGLLARVEDAFRREQATIGNIAHELRTPVATLRTAIEFRLMAAHGSDEEAVLRSCLATVEGMQSQVSNLLLLARLEAGREPLGREDGDLSALVSEAAERHEAEAARRGLELRLDLAREAPVATSPAHLQLVLDNLLGNALAHGRQGSPVAITVTADAAGAAVAIANSYDGAIASGELGEAFYRADGARSDGDHAGLGLALCRRLARLLGAGLDLSAADGTFRAVLRLPRTPAAGAPEAPCSSTPTAT